MKLLNTYDCHTITAKGSSQSAAALMRWKPVLQRLPAQPRTEPGLKARFFHYGVVVGWGVSNVMIRSSFFCTVAGLRNRIPALVRLVNSLFGVNLLFGQAGGLPHRYADFEWPLCGSVFGVKHEATCAGGPRWSKSSTRTFVNFVSCDLLMLRIVTPSIRDFHSLVVLSVERTVIFVIQGAHSTFAIGGFRTSQTV